MKVHDKLLDSILDEYQIVRFTETNYIFEDGSKISRQKFRDAVFPKDIGKIEHDYRKLDHEFYDVIGSTSVENRRKIKQRFFEDLEDIVRESSSFTGNINTVPEDVKIIGQAFNFGSYRLFRHLTNDRYSGAEVLYDITKGCISRITPEVYMSSLRSDEKASFKPLDAVFEYDPYHIAPIRSMTFEGQTVNRVNTYIAPAWRKLDTEYSNKPPALFSRFLKHMFPDVESRRFVLSWMRNAILHRAETVLILNGAKGTGKNILADFLKELVGAENFGRAKKSLIQKEFNSMLEDKRLIFMDEIRIDKAGHTFLKDICNAEHNIEKKGKDANNLTPTYHSILACNNDSSDVYLEPDDRRFSTPNLTDIRLDHTFTPVELKELVALQTDPLALKEIGEFIINYKHDAYSDPFYAFMPEKFHALVLTSLYGWQQFIMESLINSNPRALDIAHLREDTRELGVKFPSTSNKIENFLQNYHHRGLFRLAYVEKDGRKQKIHISAEFKDYLKDEKLSEDDI